MVFCFFFLEVCFWNEFFCCFLFLILLKKLKRRDSPRLSLSFSFSFPTLYFLFPDFLPSSSFFSSARCRCARVAGQVPLTRTTARSRCVFLSLLSNGGLSLLKRERERERRCSLSLAVFALFHHILSSILMHTEHESMNAKLEVERDEEIKFERRSYREREAFVGSRR